jgi:hypothetical protein
MRFLLAVCASGALLAAQACGGSGDTAHATPVETPDLSGCWWYYIVDQLVFGIVVPDSTDASGLSYRAMFASDKKMYVTPVRDVYAAFPFDAAPLRVLEKNATVIGGDLVVYSGGVGAPIVEDKLKLTGCAYEKSTLGGTLPGPGSVQFYGSDGSIDTGRRARSFWLWYNKGYEEGPDVQALAGTWEIPDSWAFGGLTLTITPAGADHDHGIVSGTCRGMEVTGYIVTRPAQPSAGVYDLSLSIGGESLTGLAAMMVFEDGDEPEGVSAGEHLAVCAASGDFTMMVGGLTDKVGP